MLARVDEKEKLLRLHNDASHSHESDSAAMCVSTSSKNSYNDDPDGACNDASDDCCSVPHNTTMRNDAFSLQRFQRSARYLHYGGVPLRSQRALHEYGIQNHATLELTTRLRGGCFSFSILLWVVIFICCLLSICTCGLSLGVAACLLPFALLLPLCCL